MQLACLTSILRCCLALSAAARSSFAFLRAVRALAWDRRAKRRETRRARNNRPVHAACKIIIVSMSFPVDGSCNDARPLKAPSWRSHLSPVSSALLLVCPRKFRMSITVDRPVASESAQHRGPRPPRLSALGRRGVFGIAGLGD